MSTRHIAPRAVPGGLARSQPPAPSVDLGRLDGQSAATHSQVTALQGVEQECCVGGVCVCLRGVCACVAEGCSEDRLATLIHAPT